MLRRTGSNIIFVTNNWENTTHMLYVKKFLHVICYIKLKNLLYINTIFIAYIMFLYFKNKIVFILIMWMNYKTNFKKIYVTPREHYTLLDARDNALRLSIQLIQIRIFR